MIQHFTISGITVPVISTLNFTQTYEEFGAIGLTRMSDGGAVPQVNWLKLRTHLTGSGQLPPGLWELSRTSSHTLRCAAHRAMDDDDNIFTLPTARRTDDGYEPTGFAVLADGITVTRTPVNIGGDIATLTTIDGALSYHIHYWPELTVWITDRKEDGDVRRANYRWSLTCEEI